jgi:RNase P subunit RPR2
MLKKQVVKIYKTTIEKYCLDIPIDEIKPLLCKSCYSFFQENKIQNF